MYKLCFTVPKTHCEKVKTAIFEAGAGKQDNYSHCSWETTGIGQFKPQSGSNPHIGNIGKIETVTEIKVETICEENILQNVIKALKLAHPYESPAIDMWKLEKTPS